MILKGGDFILDPSNQVYTILKNGISDLSPGFINVIPSEPPPYPYTYFKAAGAKETACDMENNENAVVSTIELQVYFDQNYEEAHQIITAESDIMRGLGYQRISGPLCTDDAEKTGINKLTAKYERIFCDGDEL